MQLDTLLGGGGGSSSRGKIVKLLLIPVLGYVLYSQTLGQLEADVESAQPPTQLAKPAPGTVPPTVKQSVPILSTVRPVEQIADVDPFALPESLLPPPPPVPESPLAQFLEGAKPEEPQQTEAVDPWEDARDRWAAERVSLVLSTPTGLVAVIGDRMVRVGDELDEYCRVAEIRADGIVIEPVEDDESTEPE